MSMTHTLRRSYSFSSPPTAFCAPDLPESKTARRLITKRNRYLPLPMYLRSRHDHNKPRHRRKGSSLFFPTFILLSSCQGSLVDFVVVESDIDDQELSEDPITSLSDSLEFILDLDTIATMHTDNSCTPKKTLLFIVDFIQQAQNRLTQAIQDLKAGNRNWNCVQI